MTYRFIQIPLQAESGLDVGPANVRHMNSWLKRELKSDERVIAMTSDSQSVMLLVEHQEALAEPLRVPVPKFDY